MINSEYEAIRTASIEQVRHYLQRAKEETQNAVLLTPTGKTREQLSDAFIHISAAEKLLLSIK